MRFAIRDLLWLTVVVALSAGWWLYYVSTRETLSQVDKLAVMEKIGVVEKLEFQLKQEQLHNSNLTQSLESMNQMVKQQQRRIQDLMRESTFPIERMPIVPPLEAKE